MKWIAIFSAAVAGIPMDVTDYDALRFPNKRSCYMYVMRNVPRLREVLLDNFPFPVLEIEVRGRCVLETARRADR